MKPFAAVAFLLCAAVALSAQTVVNPTKVTFTASPDHSATLADGSPLLDHYDLTVVTGSGTVFTQGLGKPTPDANNTITVPISTLTAWTSLAKNTGYILTVSAVNAVASTPSPSNPFVLLGAPRAPGKPVVQ